MFGHHFNNESTRRYIAVFGTLFNDIQIGRSNNAGTEIQRMTVPINYAPAQKLLARLEGDPNLDKPAITLPRMSFEIMGMNYNPSRKVGSLVRQTKSISTDDSNVLNLYSPAPYDIDFQLNIMTKYTEDGTKILEQILPFFKPDVTVSVKMIDSMDFYVDIPVVLQSVTTEDSYEGDFETRRVLMWTLNFQMKAFYFGPTTNKRIIKFVDNNIYTNTKATVAEEKVNVQPGLTSGGQPTTKIADSVAYSDINIDVNWAEIVLILDA